MANEDDRRRGLLAYNHSTAYVAEVLDTADSYRQEPVQSISNALGTSVTLIEIPGIGLTSASWASQVQALLAAAEAQRPVAPARSARSVAAGPPVTGAMPSVNRRASSRPVRDRLPEQQGQGGGHEELVLAEGDVEGGDEVDDGAGRRDGRSEMVDRERRRTAIDRPRPCDVGACAPPR